MSIAKRLTIVLGLIVALSLGGGLLAIAKFRQQDALVNEMMVNLQVERATAEWYSVTSSAVMRATAIVMSGDKGLSDYFANITAVGVKRTSELQKFIEQSMDTPDEVRQFEAVSKLRKEFLASKDEAVRLKAGGDDAGARKVFDERFEPVSREYLAAVKALADSQTSQIDAANAAAASQRSETIWELAGFGAVSVASAIVLALLLVRSITTPLRRAQGMAESIARLDLSQAGLASYASDETGRLLQAIETMRGALTRSLSQVRGVADGISTASSQIASGNQDLSARTEVTASNLQETASSMEQITAAVRQSADAAAQANQLASSATQVARRGGDVVSQVVATMEEINSSSKKIADIIGVIDGIAFQTNILALNAAVEAARAGEQGRGFAVVAGEVRSLAQRSAEAAKEIKSLIGSSVDKVEAGSRLVQDAGATMSEIVASVQRVTDIIGEISASTSEQSGGIGQVGIAVQQLDQMTQQNAALVEESAAAASSLNEQARQLDEAIGSFRLAAH